GRRRGWSNASARPPAGRAPRRRGVRPPPRRPGTGTPRATRSAPPRVPPRVPAVAGRLRLEARAVGPQPADGQVAEPRLRQVPLEWVVERDVSVLDEEHHRCGGEGLRD